MSEELKPCHCGYKGTIDWINHQGDYLSAICPECKRTVVHDTLVGLIKSWNTGQEAALKAGQGEAAALPPQCTDRKEHVKYRCGWNSCISAVARLNQLRRGTPVAHVSEESFSSDGTSDIITHNLPIGTALYTHAPGTTDQVETAEPYGYLREVDGNVQLSIGPARPTDRSGGCATPWSAIFAAPPATADAVSVPRELLESLLERYDSHALVRSTMSRVEELRALLARQEVKS